jgi:phage/plasmid-associated DNA primase
VLLKNLEDEAPHFLKTLLSVTLPEPDGRTSVAVLDTDYKTEQAEENAPVVIFLRDCCAIGHGYAYAKTLLYAAYVQWCEASDRKAISREDFGRQVLEFGAGIIRPRGKVVVKEERFDGQITERRHDAYQGICLKAQPWVSTPVSAPISPTPAPDDPTPTCS